MASVNFAKCKAGSGSAGALLRHCDERERLKHDHSNEHIQKELTHLNRQGPRSYEQTMAALRDRLADLDRQPGSNKRKDRVEMFMLEVPIPNGYDAEKFTEMVLREVREQYGRRNVLNWYLHRDEIHEYMDHKQIKTSLAHIHIPVVPEVDGRLNGKAFSSRANMIRLNNAIDDRAREIGGPGFMTGESARKKTVEELKIESAKELQSTVADLSYRADELRTELEETQEEIKKAKEYHGHVRESIENAQGQKVTALRDRDKERSDTDIHNALNRVVNGLRTASVPEVEELAVVPEKRTVRGKIKQPEAVLVPRDQLDAIKKTAKTITQGKSLAEGIERERGALQRAANEKNKNWLDRNKDNILLAIESEQDKHLDVQRQMQREIDRLEREAKEKDRDREKLQEQNAKLQEQLNKLQDESGDTTRKADEFDLVCQEHPEVVMLVGKDRYICRTDEREEKYIEFDPEDFYASDPRRDPGEEYDPDWELAPDMFYDEIKRHKEKMRSRDDGWDR